MFAGTNCMSKPLSEQIKDLRNQTINLELSQQRLEKLLEEALEFIQIQTGLIKDLYKSKD